MTQLRLNILLLGAFLAAMLVSLLSGKVWVPPGDWLRGDLASLIILELRLPRTILAAAIGAALGMSGAVMQGYLRNPLADPGLFGVSGVTWASTAATEDLSLYRAMPTEVNVWGQGAAMRFAAERIRSGLN